VSGVSTPLLNHGTLTCGDTEATRKRKREAYAHVDFLVCDGGADLLVYVTRGKGRRQHAISSSLPRSFLIGSVGRIPTPPTVQTCPPTAGAAREEWRMSTFAFALRCTPEQLDIFQHDCFLQGHQISCLHCKAGKDIVNGLRTPRGFRIHYQDKGGWLCRDCGSDLRGQIREHMNRCPNFAERLT
jgi:hypothetical protein